MFLFDGNQTKQKGAHVCPPVYYIMDLEFKAIIMFERPTMMAKSFYLLNPHLFRCAAQFVAAKS